MNHRLGTQATALGLAALVTLTLMASIDRLATTPPAADTLARTEAPAQVVVVTAQRLPRS